MMCTEDSLFYIGGSSTCAGFTAMPEGNFVILKAHAQIENSEDDCFRVHRSWIPNTMESRAKTNIGFELIVVCQV